MSTSALSHPLPVSNLKLFSASEDGTPDAEGIASSLSTTYSMASALTSTTIATDSCTVVSSSRDNDEGESLGGGEGSGSGKEIFSGNENLTSGASAVDVLPDTRSDLGSSGGQQQTQTIDFTATASLSKDPPHTPISASPSIPIPLPMPSPKSDVEDDEYRMKSASIVKQQHRKSASVGGVISSITFSTTTTTTAGNATVTMPTAKVVQHCSVGGSIKPGTVELDQKEKEKKNTSGTVPQQKLPQQQQQQQLLVNTPPEMLPPSPPLTNNELEVDDEGDEGDESSDRGRDDTTDADADAEADVDTDGHTRSQSQSQTEVSDAQDEDDDGDVDGVNPQIEADIADGWQAPDSKLETTPGTPVLPSQSPSTTSLPLPLSSQIQIQGNKIAAALSKSALSSTSSPERLTTPNDPLSPSSPNVPSSSSPLRIKISHSDIIDLEKGDQADHMDVDAGDGMANRRISIEAEAEDTSGSLGVTKAFEVIRTANKRLSSPQPPRSSYYMGPPATQTAFGTPPTGQIGLHHPREIVRVERDFDHGELVQFSSAYPLEFEGRITPTQFLETINAINEHLIRAHSLSGAFFFNLLAILTLWISPFFMQSTYSREMRNLQVLVDALNANLYNPRGLNILWPRRNAFLFLEIEYY